MVMSMTTTTMLPDGVELEEWFDPELGIAIRAPHHASLPGPIPIKVDVGADDRTHAAIKGFFDGAVDLIMVRRDRPGAFYVPTYDPHQIGYPPVGFGEEEPVGAAPYKKGDPRDVVGETLHVDLAENQSVRQGSATYFLIGGFARWWSKPHSIRIVSPDGPAPVDERPLRVASVEVATTAGAPPTPSVPTLRLDQLGSRQFLRAILPPPAHPRAAPPSSPPPSGRSRTTVAKPFFTVVGFRLQSRGGSVMRVFTPLVPSGDAGGATGATHGAIESTIAFSSFEYISAGPWVFLLFVGDQISEPLKVTLTNADRH